MWPLHDPDWRRRRWSRAGLPGQTLCCASQVCTGCLLVYLLADRLCFDPAGGSRGQRTAATPILSSSHVRAHAHTGSFMETLQRQREVMWGRWKPTVKGFDVLNMLCVHALDSGHHPNPPKRKTRCSESGWMTAGWPFKPGLCWQGRAGALISSQLPARRLTCILWRAGKVSIPAMVISSFQLQRQCRAWGRI